MKCLRELRRILSDMENTRKIGPNDVLGLFVELRKLFEERGKYRERYVMVNLACNWIVHTTLRRSNTIYKLLHKISVPLCRLSLGGHPPGSTDTKDLLIDTAATIFDFPKIRRDIIEILDLESLPTVVPNSKVLWDQLIFHYLQKVLEQPLSFPEDVISGKNRKNKSAITAFEKLMAIPHNPPFEPAYSLEIIEDMGRFKLMVNRGSRFVHIFPLGVFEPEEEFHA